MGEFDPDNLSSNPFKILILGGSTTFSDFHSDDFEDSWTHALGSILSAHNPGKEFRIFNAGLNAGMSSELLAHFVFEVQKISPDLVIIHGPGNDLLPMLLGDVSTDYRLTRRSIQFGRRPGERFLLRHIGLFRFVYSIWLSNISLSLFSTPNMPNISTQALNAIQLYPSQFKANLKMFVGICQAFEMKLLLVDFLQAPQPKLVQIWPELAESSIIAIEKMNSSMGDEASVHESGVYHLKFDSSLFHEDFFLDNCHLNTQGEKVKAKIISEFLLRNQIV
jgi:lysophospholipase L1-like esterase